MIRFWIKLGIIEYLVGSSTRGTRALAYYLELKKHHLNPFNYT